jgi:hypothetical protein
MSEDAAARWFLVIFDVLKLHHEACFETLNAT